MDRLTKPICVDRRSVAFSRPHTESVLKALTVIFLFTTLSVITPFGRQNVSLGDRGGCDFPAIFNFGDSNSDTGAKSAAFRRNPYPNGETFFHRASGRYGDGKIILDFIAEKLDLPYVSAFLDSMGTNFRHGANFAVGGATIQSANAKIYGAGYSPFSLKTQLLQFKQFKERVEEIYSSEGLSSYVKISLPRREDFSKALYTLDIGQNDIDFGLKSMTEDELKASLPRIVGMLAQTIMELYQQGGRRFWIHNTGPIGCLPSSIINFPPKPENVDQNGCIKSYNGAAEEFNRLLKQRVLELRVELSDAVLTYVDVYSVKYSLISEAKKHGFDDPLGYCCGHDGENFIPCWKKATVNGTETNPNACEDPSKYISWDGIHYTQSANNWVASQILDGFHSDPAVPITEVYNKSLEFNAAKPQDLKI